MTTRIIRPEFVTFLAGSVLVTTHFSAEEFNKGRGWVDAVESHARYSALATCSLEILRAILGRMDVNSGERSPENNAKGGRPSSHHMRPADRANLRERQRPGDRSPKLLEVWPELAGAHSAAADFMAANHPEDVAWHVIDICQRRGIIPPGGAFWYAGRPGGRFVHVDDRGVIARDKKLTPDESGRSKAQALIERAMAKVQD